MEPESGNPKPETTLSIISDFMDPWLTQLTEKLLRCYSPSKCERNAASLLKNILEELGLETSFDNAHQAIDGECGNLYAVLPAKDASIAPILLNAHMDTLEADQPIIPLIEDGKIMSSGNTILGADDKAGIIAILYALKKLKEASLSHGRIEVLFTIAEEIGLLGAKNADYSRIQAKSAYVLDSSGPVNKIVISAPWQNSISAVFKGISAHSGLEPEKGRSAIQAASAAIAGMGLGRINEASTANIGIIAGGKASNVIPEHTTIEGEARSLHIDQLDRITEEMTEKCRYGAESFGCEVDIAIERAYDGYRLDENGPTIRRLAGALDKKGIDAQFISSGGGSDTNILNTKGIEAVCFGMGAYKVHTNKEYLDIREMIQAGEIMVEVLTARG